MVALKWCLWEEGEKENKVGMEFGEFGAGIESKVENENNVNYWYVCS